MKFKYINNTPDAPLETVIFGYKFILDGESVEVKEEEFIKKMCGMAHTGIVQVCNLDAEPQIIKETDEETSIKQIATSKNRKNNVSNQSAN
jgi:hypothetical protein